MINTKGENTHDERTLNNEAEVINKRRQHPSEGEDFQTGYKTHKFASEENLVQVVSMHSYSPKQYK